MTDTVEITVTWQASDGTLFNRGWVFCIDAIIRKIYTVIFRPGCRSCTKLMDHFRITYNGVIYDIPEVFAARSNKQVPSQNESTDQWNIRKATQDAYEKDGQFDMVGAVADFFGLNIAAKPFGDQADYETPQWVIDRLRDARPVIAKGLGVNPGGVGEGEGAAPSSEYTE